LKLYEIKKSCSARSDGVISFQMQGAPRQGSRSNPNQNEAHLNPCISYKKVQIKKNRSGKTDCSQKIKYRIALFGYSRQSRERLFTLPKTLSIGLS
jgi:hypothetical protein